MNSSIAEKVIAFIQGIIAFIRMAWTLYQAYRNGDIQMGSFEPFAPVRPRA